MVRLRLLEIYSQRIASGQQNYSNSNPVAGSVPKREFKILGQNIKVHTTDWLQDMSLKILRIFWKFWNLILPNYYISTRFSASSYNVRTLHTSIIYDRDGKVLVLRNFKMIYISKNLEKILNMLTPSLLYLPPTTDRV